jgi:hypothetical protein
MVGVGGVASAYVHSTISQYQNAAPCSGSKLPGIAGVLQSAHFFAEAHDCVLGPKGGCKNANHCEVTVISNGVPVDSGKDGNCRTVGQACLCVPQGNDQ